MACFSYGRETGRSVPVQGLALIAVSLITLFDPEMAFSQSLEDEANSEIVLESVVTGSEDTPDILNKIDLNAATDEDLLQLPGMSSEFTASISEYRHRVKFIHSIDELSRLDGVTDTLLDVLRLHTFINEENNLSLRVDSYSEISVQKSPLYREAYGDAGMLNFQRISAVYHNLELYAITDKDPGEHNYLDFYSASLVVKGLPFASSVYFGNYSVSLGNGILFSSASVISKGAGPISSLFNRSAYSLRPYRSRQETRFLRGAAAGVPIGKFELTAFVSLKDYNSHIDSTGRVTSVDYTGLNYPTVNPESNRKLRENLIGGILRYDCRWASFGLTSVSFNYDRHFASRYLTGGMIYETFLRAQRDDAAFSGEAVLDKVLSYSLCGRLDYQEAEFAAGVRNLRSAVISNYGGALSESYPSVMEQGAYFGSTFRPAKNFKLGFYYDRFRLISISTDPERNGEEISADSFISLRKGFLADAPEIEIYLRYKFKTKEDFYLSLFEFPTALSTISQSKQNFRIDLRTKLSREFSVRARVEKNFLATGETGELFIFDSRWRSNLLLVDSRICFYRTSSYATAFYATEGSLPGVSEFTLLYGDGMRLMILADIEVFTGVSVGIKITRNIYQGNREVSVGSSWRNLPGVTEISFELSYDMI